MVRVSQDQAVIQFWIFPGSLLIGHLLARAVARFGPRLKLLDQPGPRSSHRQATPRGGGLGILAAFAVTAGATGLPVHLGLPASLISLLSFINDRREFSPVLRLACQFAAAAGMLSGFPALWEGSLGGMALLLFLGVYTVGTANIYNFMDGINGISGLTAIVAFGLLWLFGCWSQSLAPYQAVCLAVTGAALGFLPLNFPRARVFLGDGGSILIGFVFASLAIAGSGGAGDFLVLNILLWPYFMDELTTMAARLKDRESLLEAHRRHLYQLLANQGGYSHGRVALGYALAQAAIGIGCYLGRGRPGLLGGILLILCAVFLALNHTIRRRWDHPEAQRP